jgi:hypothetical protein
MNSNSNEYDVEYNNYNDTTTPVAKVKGWGVNVVSAAAVVDTSEVDAVDETTKAVEDVVLNKVEEVVEEKEAAKVRCCYFAFVVLF